MDKYEKKPVKKIKIIRKKKPVKKKDEKKKEEPKKKKVIKIVRKKKQVKQTEPKTPLNRKDVKQKKDEGEAKTPKTTPKKQVIKKGDKFISIPRKIKQNTKLDIDKLIKNKLSANEILKKLYKANVTESYSLIFDNLDPHDRETLIPYLYKKGIKSLKGWFGSHQNSKESVQIQLTKKAKELIEKNKKKEVKQTEKPQIKPKEIGIIKERSKSKPGFASINTVIRSILKLLNSNNESLHNQAILQLRGVKPGNYTSESKGVLSPNYSLEKHYGGSFTITSQQNNIITKYLFDEKGKTISVNKNFTKKEKPQTVISSTPTKHTIIYKNKKGEDVKIRLPDFEVNNFLKKELRDLDLDRKEFLQGKYVIKQKGDFLGKAVPVEKLKRIFPENTVKDIVMNVDKYRKEIITKRKQEQDKPK